MKERLATPNERSGKTLTERVAIAVQKRKAAPGSTNRAIVLANKAAIAAALDAGFSVMDVWVTLRSEGAVNCSYQAFRGHVNRSVLNRGRSTSSPTQSRKPSTKPTGLASFKFDPKPNKEDLL